MFRELRRIKNMELINEVFEDIENFENPYGISITTKQYSNLKEKWRQRFEK